jgi:23S rRNA (pseudouridine1915-N3)-methyltransferase
MKLSLVSVGKPKGVLRPAILDYETRVSRYFGFESFEVGAGKGGTSEIRVEEGERLLARLPTGARVYALTRLGDRCSSLDLASQFEELSTYGPGAAAFLIGGALGLGENVLQRADRQVSLSDMTLPHELARLVLLEQLYRAGTIMRGEPYHKGS